MGMDLRFRTATSADCEALVELVNSAYRGESSQTGWTTESHLLAGLRTDREMIAEMLSRPDSHLLLAFDEESRLMASAHLERRSTGRCYFGMFSVRPSGQTRGIGKALLAQAEQLARDVYKSTAMEMTVITARTELIAWYVRRGYRQTKAMVPFPVDPKFGVLKVPFLEMEVLEKSLTPS
jgi:GNAT superfamily N-acetyltransferase